ncbi:MAG: glycosyltransferase family 2 protein, partial [bacterium]
MNDHHPKISVCIPAFNCGRYLRQAIDSVLRQSRQDFEIIVYDDASTDDTPQVIAAVQDTHVRYFRNPRNLGVAATRNNCLAVARGKYIAWLDADDLYYSQALEIQNAMLDCYSNVGLVHGAYHVIDQDGRRLPDWPQPFSSHVIKNGR